MGINVGTAVAFLELDMSGFRDSISSAGESLKNFATGGGIQNLSDAMSGVGSELTKKVTLPIVGIGAAATNASMDFEAQMSKVKAISGATGDDFQKLRDQAIQLGADTSFSASGAAEGMENLASAGFKNTEIMAAMPGMLSLAAAGGIEISTASDIAGSALRGFGMEAEQVTHVADVLAKAAGDTNAEIVDTGEAMKYIAPVAHSLGISFEDIAAAIGMLSNAGIKGSQAGTTLRGALTNLASPAKAAKKVMKDLNLEFFDSEGKMKPLTDVIQELKVKTKDLTSAEKAAAFAHLFGKEAMSGMLALVDQGPEAFDELSKSLKGCDGASKEMADTMQDNLAGSIEAMKGSIETAAIKIGDVLAPMIKSAAEWIADLVNKFSNLPKPMQEFIVKAALIAAAIGPVLIILAKLIESVRTVVSVFTGISKIASVVQALPALMSGPIGWITLAIIGLAVVIYEVVKHWDTIKAYFTNWWAWVKRIFSENFAWLKRIFSEWWAWVTRIFTEWFAWVKRIFSELWEWMKKFFGEWGPTILVIIAPFLGIPLQIIKHWDAIKEAFTAIWEHIKSACEKIGNILHMSAEGWKMAFKDLVEFMKNVGKWIVDGLLGGLSSGWDKVKSKVTDMAGGIKNTFKKLLGIHSPSRVFAAYGGFIGEGLIQGLDNQEGAIDNKFTGIATKIKDIGKVKPNFDGLKDIEVSGAYGGTSMRGLGNYNNKTLNFTPNINMNVSISDTGNKGTAQLTNELKGMAQNAFKNSMVDEFMSDAFRL